MAKNLRARARNQNLGRRHGFSLAKKAIQKALFKASKEALKL
jgi:hypothetical protein